MRRWLAVAALLSSLAACGPTGTVPGGERAPAAPAPGGAPAAAPLPGRSAPAAVRPLERVTIGVPGASMSYFPAHLAWKLGYFAEEGLAPEFPRVGGNATIPSLLSGELDFTTILSAIGAHAGNGGPTKIVQWHSVRLQHVVTVRPDITAPQQLENKRMAVQSLGTITSFETTKLAEHFGLRNLGQVVAGGELERLAAVEASAADAAIMTIPVNIIAEQRGYPTLLQVGRILEIPQAGLGTGEEQIRDKADLLTRALRASARALPDIRARRDEVVQLIAEWIEISPDDAARAYEQVVDTYSPNGLATEAQENAYMDLMRASANVPASAGPAQFFDYTLARRAAADLGLPH